MERKHNRRPGIIVNVVPKSMATVDGGGTFA